MEVRGGDGVVVEGRQRKQRAMKRGDYPVTDGRKTWLRINVSPFAGE